MTGQAGQLQPDGQSNATPGRALLKLPRFLPWLGLLGAMLVIVIPFNRGGLWDPQELRIAELARRLAHQLYGSDTALIPAERLAWVTQRQLGQGELSVTSPAIGFALFGVSDWSGRVASLAWGGIALVSLWLLMGRLGRLVQVTSVMLLATLPLFAWQSRTMLGDAATIATLILSTSALILLVLGAADEPKHWARSFILGALASIGLVAGVFARGVLVGIAVPCLSVGIVSLAHQSEGAGVTIRRWLGWLLVGVGLGATSLGLREILHAAPGFSGWLGASLTATPRTGPFVVVLSNVMHEAFPLSAFLPVALPIALARSRSDAQLSASERFVALSLALTVMLSMAASVLMATRADAMPFPAVAAVSGLSGLAVARLHRSKSISFAAVATTVLTMAVLVFADYVNLPDKVMLMTGVGHARFPDSFKAESDRWLASSLTVLGLGCVALALLGRRQQAKRPSLRASCISSVERIRSAFGGQLLSGFVLVETALVTTALLQRAHERGWISVPAFDSIRTLAGSLLSWAWAGPPLVLFAAPALYLTALATVSRVTTVQHSARLPTSLGIVRSNTPWWPLTAGSLIGYALILSSLIVSIGHAPAMAERLSPKRAIMQYQAHALSGEELALLGIKPESVGYYLGAVPPTFGDIDEAAKWLNAATSKRRWLTFESERLPELNAAFRAASAGHNLPILDPLEGNIVLAASQLRASEKDYNPLAIDVLSTPPATAHKTTVDFGNVIRLIGWELDSSSQRDVVILNGGHVYELRLVFEVLGTSAIDWQVFVHLDGRGHRHNGDHEPAAGRYPTSLWQPGDIVVDRHQMVLERGALPGPVTLFFGLFRGSRRLEVTSGDHEDNRVKLGDIELR